MRGLVLLVILFCSYIVADEVKQPKNGPIISVSTLSVDQIAAHLREIDQFLNRSNNIWMQKYANYKNFYDVSLELDYAKEEMIRLKNAHNTLEAQTEIFALQRRIETLEKQKSLLEEYKEDPYKELMYPTTEDTAPQVTNPILIIQGFSYIRSLKQEYERLNSNYESLDKLITQLENKQQLLLLLQQMPGVESTLLPYSVSSESLVTERAIEDFKTTQSIFVTILDLYDKKVEEQVQQLTVRIKEQIIKGIIVGVIILISVLIAFVMKIGIRKYIQDNERIYTLSKIINFINITLIMLILLFAYLENVTYLVTILGFASAGLAIAMKDLFMSVLGWIVIMVGGSIHVGDRIRVSREGSTFVGDVLDISILRITLHEGVTWLTYTDSRRAGRIIFVPNNYVFTNMIANYTHGSMKTVWDGIDITITFDSNHKKAVQICLDVAKRYAKGYTDITRKQLNLLRDRYSLRNTNVEPRVFTILESYGIRVSLWYQTNAYAALTLRSTISADIIDLINQESDIQIAYPTTTVHASSSKPIVSDGAIPPDESAKKTVNHHAGGVFDGL